MSTYYQFSVRADADAALAVLNASTLLRASLAPYGYYTLGNGDLYRIGGYRIKQWAGNTYELQNGKWAIPSLRPFITRVNQAGFKYLGLEQAPSDAEILARCEQIELAHGLPTPSNGTGAVEIDG